MDHRATQPLISGSLDRKGKIMRRYDTNYYVVSPSKFLHEFKTDDDLSKDPSPELSLFLPDCAVGAIDGDRFDIKGKDVSGRTAGKMSMSHNYSFKAHTVHDAAQWWEIIRTTAGQITNLQPNSTPVSPVSPQTAEGERFGTLPVASSAGTEGATHPSAADEKAQLAANEAERKEAAHAAGQTVGTTGGTTAHEGAPESSYVPGAAASAPHPGPVSTSAAPGKGVETKPATSTA